MVGRTHPSDEHLPDHRFQGRISATLTANPTQYKRLIAFKLLQNYRFLKKVSLIDTIQTNICAKSRYFYYPLPPNS